MDALPIFLGLGALYLLTQNGGDGANGDVPREGADAGSARTRGGVDDAVGGVETPATGAAPEARGGGTIGAEELRAPRSQLPLDRRLLMADRGTLAAARAETREARYPDVVPDEPDRPDLGPVPSERMEVIR